MTTETIQMTFHKAETKAEAVKPRRLDGFRLGDRVTRGGAVGTVVQDCAMRRFFFCSNTVHESCKDEWYLESDIINGRPREIAGEPVRKPIGTLSRDDVIAGDCGINYRVVCHLENRNVVVERLYGGGHNVHRHDTIVDVLGRVTFGEQA